LSPFIIAYGLLGVAFDIIVLLLALPFAPLIVWLSKDMLWTALCIPWSTREEVQYMRENVAIALALPVFMPIGVAIMLVVAVAGLAWDILLIAFLWVTFPLSPLMCWCSHSFEDVSEVLVGLFAAPWRILYECAEDPQNLPTVCLVIVTIPLGLPFALLSLVLAAVDTLVLVGAIVFHSPLLLTSARYHMIECFRNLISLPWNALGHMNFSRYITRARRHRYSLTH
jgi:hypothetical protein